MASFSSIELNQAIFGLVRLGIEVALEGSILKFGQHFPLQKGVHSASWAALQVPVLRQPDLKIGQHFPPMKGFLCRVWLAVLLAISGALVEKANLKIGQHFPLQKG
jgi:hypothetical protein